MILDIFSSLATRNSTSSEDKKYYNLMLLGFVLRAGRSHEFYLKGRSTVLVNPDALSFYSLPVTSLQNIVKFTVDKSHIDIPHIVISDYGNTNKRVSNNVYNDQN